ncbi:MAG: RNB domain-containing ribonuclease [Planctomycetota bacterium]
MSDPSPHAKDSARFRSFRELRRARAGEEAGGEAAQGTWRLETVDERSLKEALAALDSPLGATARERIRGRPAGFGAMESGPPAYRAEDSEEMALLAAFRLRTVFPADVRAEAAALPADPRPEDGAGRLDLRGETIFTIDGEDARDFDDAIGIRPLPDGAAEVGVHIADVAHYVRPGTALDDEALARATSVYLPDQVLPMLPEELSNGLCSLVPHRDRLAYSVLMAFDARGERTSARVAKSVIRSVHRHTYRVVQDLLDGKDTPETREIRHLEEPLRLFQRWTLRQQALRDARGSLRMQSRERKFLFDANHEVAAIVDDPRYFSQTLIEETALAANQAVGDLFRGRGLPAIYRVHPEKSEEEIAAVREMLEKHGIRVPAKERLTGRDIGRLIRAARNRKNAEALIARIMGLVERAFYEVHDHEDPARHFGLAREAYLHFTSPIRRYPDLMVHRWLGAIESRGAAAEQELRAAELVAGLNDVAAHCSLQAEVAEMAEIAVGDLKVCQFMAPHVGETFEATVARVSPAGLELFLGALHVDGFLPARLLGDRPKVEGPTLTVRAGKRTLSFTEGYPIRVRVKDVDFLRLQVLFVPA